jgi:hypothetical protein
LSLYAHKQQQLNVVVLPKSFLCSQRSDETWWLRQAGGWEQLKIIARQNRVVVFVVVAQMT